MPLLAAERERTGLVFIFETLARMLLAGADAIGFLSGSALGSATFFCRALPEADGIVFLDNPPLGSCTSFFNWIDADEVGFLDDSALRSCIFLLDASLEAEEMCLSDTSASGLWTFFCDAPLLALDEVAVVDVLGRVMTRFAGWVFAVSTLGLRGGDLRGGDLLGGEPEIGRQRGGCVTGR